MMLFAYSMSVLAWVILAVHAWQKNRRKQYGSFFLTALLLKSLAATVITALYMWHYKGGDTLSFFNDARQLIVFFSERPDEIISFLLGNSDLSSIGLRFENDPRALFFSAFTSLFVIVGAGNIWLSALWMSLISFLCIWWSIQQISRENYALGKAAVWVLIFWPGVLIWTSGIFKETPALVCLCLLSAIVYRAIHRAFDVKDSIICILSIWLLWNLKYYYAAVFLPLSAATFLSYRIFSQEYIVQKRMKVLVAYTFFCIIPLIIVSVSHFNLRPLRLLELLFDNYQLSVLLSMPGKHAVYEHMDGSLYYIIFHIPDALFTTLFRPMLWESWNIFSVVVAIENTILLALFAFAIVHTQKTGAHWLMLLSVFLFVFFMFIFLGLTSPNFGTLHRYRSLAMPFWLIWQIYILINRQGSNNFSTAA
ncbi:MAG: hypothetical protein JJU28_04065 [Cyclobacteriaceae bacterium]|nr:hypothetical protein [Cyclobacteriaceae bacterium]